MQEYAPASRDEAFAQAREYFAETEDWLASGGASGMQHADLEEQMEKRGREITRRMLQGHLDLLAAREERRHDVTGDDGVVRTRAERGRVRPLMTKFGQVSVSRIGYRSPGRSNVHPLDAALNLPEEKHSHGLRKLARGGGRARVARGRSGRDRPRGQRADRKAPGRRAGPPRCRARGGVLPVAGDRAGAGRVPAGADLRREGDRDAAGRAAPGHRESSSCRGGKLATRLSPGEKNGRKRMAELACVYDAVPAPRTPEEVISTPAQKLRKKKAQAATPNGKGKPREPQARGKWLTASVTDDIPAVIAAAFDEAERRDPGNDREWVVLIDGNNTQIEAVTAEAARRGVKVTIVIDFIHVLEYLWKAAWSFFDKGEPAAEEWVAAQARRVLHGKSAQVAAGIRRRSTTYGYSPAERAGADECARYLRNREDYLGYATALKKGWPIATGIIEGAARWLVKDRMDITGARWGLEGAEAILELRAMIASGDFEDYWRFHLRREHERIHHAKYRESHVLAA